MDLWKDQNAETFLANMPYFTEIYLKQMNKTDEITELKLGLSERVVKTVLGQYFYNQNIVYICQIKYIKDSIF